MSEIKKKLSSRKFWMAVAAFVTSVCAMVGWGADTIERVVALITAVGALVAYIFAEGWADAAWAKQPIFEFVEETEQDDAEDDEATA
ncbi:hypothetical protein AGMMS49992_16760 [Clostridia bacterium]|nr:hypothetical protein AGMMS49992_16760 [Clostridia bacterium]